MPHLSPRSRPLILPVLFLAVLAAAPALAWMRSDTFAVSPKLSRSMPPAPLVLVLVFALSVT